MYIHKLKLDLNAKPNSITMYVKQGDTGRQLETSVFADGEFYDLQGSTVSIHVDNESLFVDVTEHTNIVVLDVPGLVEPGLKCGDIAIVKDGKIISTANFKVKVIKSPNNGEV